MKISSREKFFSFEKLSLGEYYYKLVSFSIGQTESVVLATGFAVGGAPPPHLHLTLYVFP